MPERYSERTVDFPICPGCHEIVYSEAGCLNCMTEPPPTCGVDWLGCGPQSIWHECRLYEGHRGDHACEHCTATSTTGVRA